MYEMERDGVAGLSREAKIHQRMLFTNKTEEILALPENRESCCNKTTMFEYNGKLIQMYWCNISVLQK